MLLYTLSICCHDAIMLLTKLDGSKKAMAAQQNQINLGKENYIPFHGYGELLRFFHYSQVYLRSLTNQLLNNNSLFANICGGCGVISAL